MTNIARSCFFINRSLSSWERFLAEYKWNLPFVVRTVIRILMDKLGDSLKIHGAYLIAIPPIGYPTLMAKVANRMLGVQKWEDHSGNPGRGSFIVGHHWAVLGLICKQALKYCCWPVMARLISGNRNPSQFIGTSDGIIRPANFWDVVLALIFEFKTYIGLESFRVVADAYFAKSCFIQPLIGVCRGVITKMRKDAVGWDEPQASKGRGRPRKVGKKWKLADLIRRFNTHRVPERIEVNIYGEIKQVAVVARDMFIRDIKEKVRIVVVKGATEPIILLSTDLSLTPGQIIEIYASRFSIELAIRDLTQHFGWGDYQCYSSIAILRFIHLSMVSFCLWKLTFFEDADNSWLDVSTNRLFPKESASSFFKIRRALKIMALKKIILTNSAPDAELQKIDSFYEPLFRIAA